MHVIPDLKKLEKKYKDELVVIGVHSAKFTTERETENIRQAVLRYEVEHPIINDSEMTIWRQYAVRAWPTFVLIDPTGKVIGYKSGEGIFEPFDELIGNVIEHFDGKGLIDRTRMELSPEKDKVPSTLLSFPGKILADDKSRRLFIADSNHNRIVVASLDNSVVQKVIGTGHEGWTDGGFDEARFNHPQGMAFDGRTLFVADTENHLIRAVDMKSEQVSTIAGTGVQGRGYGSNPGSALSTGISSPWDLVLHENNLYIAMAGTHQIWVLNLRTNKIMAHAGSGRENRFDGPLLGAALAQPSGLTTDGSRLYFADSEVSAIRSADLDRNGKVRTIAGGELFEYGDKDGKGLSARFQHPLGVTYHDGHLYIADTYNNKIRRIRIVDGTVRSFVGSGKAGMDDSPNPSFDEPGGVSIADGKLYVADTNNHLIRTVDLETKNVETLMLTGIDKLHSKDEEYHGKIIDLSPQKTATGECNFIISLQLPSDHKLTDYAPSSVKITSSDEGAISFNGSSEHVEKNASFPLKVSASAVAGEATLNLDMSIYYCSSGKEGLCYFDEARLVLPIEVLSNFNGSDLTVDYTLNHQDN